MNTYLESLTDEQICKLLIDDELLTLGIVKEAARRLQAYSEAAKSKT